MKKSEITVSMPMSAFEELISFKQKYNDLTSKIVSCFNTDFFQKENKIILDFDKIFELSKNQLPIRFQNSNILILEK